MGNLYKILVKVLANGLKKVIGKVVLESQNAFVKGRQMLFFLFIKKKKKKTNARCILFYFYSPLQLPRKL